MNKILLSGAVALAAGCTTPRDAPPDVTMRASATAEETVGCLVSALDAQFPGSTFMGGVDHHAVLVVPGRVYEVTPTTPRSVFFPSETYNVRVTAEDGAALMELRSSPAMLNQLEPAVEACSA